MCDRPWTITLVRQDALVLAYPLLPYLSSKASEKSSCQVQYIYTTENVVSGPLKKAVDKVDLERAVYGAVYETNTQKAEKSHRSQPQRPSLTECWVVVAK